MYILIGSRRAGYKEGFEEHSRRLMNYQMPLRSFLETRIAETKHEIKQNPSFDSDFGLGLIDSYKFLIHAESAFLDSIKKEYEKYDKISKETK